MNVIINFCWMDLFSGKQHGPFLGKSTLKFEQSTFHSAKSYKVTNIMSEKREKVREREKDSGREKERK
jgi:hypothetical protein